MQMVAMERGKYYMGGKVQGLEIPTRVFPCATPAEVRSTLPKDTDVLAFQCRNPIHRWGRVVLGRAALGKGKWVTVLCSAATPQVGRGCCGQAERVGAAAHGTQEGLQCGNPIGT